MNGNDQRTPYVPAAGKIKEAFDRIVKAIALRPSIGLGTGVSRTRLVRGFAAEITEGAWKLSADMPAGLGGDASAPTPGVFGRAALGSCLAQGYALEAAKTSVPFDAIEVEIQADFDDGALLGVSGNPPGYLEVRYTVTIRSSASEEALRRLVDSADTRSPYLDIFRRAQSCVRTLRINPAPELR